MATNNIFETLRRLRRYGFELRITSSIAMASPSERQLNAVQAAASVLFNVDVEAFGKGGIWAPVGKHVMSKGLREMYKVEAVELGLTTAVELASVNIVIAFAVELLEFVEAAAS